MIRKLTTATVCIAGAATASYLAWCRTAEGIVCGRFVREEMAKYRAMKAQLTQIRNLPEAGHEKLTTQ